MRFGDLKTGDIMTLMDEQCVIMAIEKPHPQNSGFWLIVWYNLNSGWVSCDMLHPEYSLIEGSKVHSDGMVTWMQAGNKLRHR